MQARHAASAARRHAHHQRRLDSATTERGAFWVACEWLVAEAVRGGRLVEATRAVLALVAALSDGRPVTVCVFDSNGGVEKPAESRRVSGTRRAREVSDYAQSRQPEWDRRAS